MSCRVATKAAWLIKTWSKSQRCQVQYPQHTIINESCCVTVMRRMQVDACLSQPPKYLIHFLFFWSGLLKSSFIIAKIQITPREKFQARTRYAAVTCSANFMTVILLCLQYMIYKQQEDIWPPNCNSHSQRRLNHMEKPPYLLVLLLLLSFYSCSVGLHSNCICFSSLYVNMYKNISLITGEVSYIGVSWATLKEETTYQNILVWFDKTVIRRVYKSLSRTITETFSMLGCT